MTDRQVGVVYSGRRAAVRRRGFRLCDVVMLRRRVQNARFQAGQPYATDM